MLMKNSLLRDVTFGVHFWTSRVISPLKAVLNKGAFEIRMLASHTVCSKTMNSKQLTTRVKLWL